MSVSGETAKDTDQTSENVNDAESTPVVADIEKDVANLKIVAAEEAVDDASQIDNEKVENSSNKGETDNGISRESEDSAGDEPIPDDDEIEENPAYIPKKGKYYMHDSRDDEVVDDGDKKKSRADGAWKHDRFDERWQRPKSSKQLRTKYGFDIRVDEKDEAPITRVGDSAEENNLRGDKDVSSKKMVQKTSKNNRLPSAKDGGESVERGGDRRQAPAVPKIIRNVRGGRNSYAPHPRSDRNNIREGSQSYNRGSGSYVYDNEERGTNSAGNRDFRPSHNEFANHRRGATRGKVRNDVSRGSATSRPYTRTFSSSHNDRVSMENGRNGGFPARITGASSRGVSMGGHIDSRYARGVSQNRGGSWRGGVHSHRLSASGPKRYSQQRHDGGGPPNNRSFVPRQPTDVVYFDPSQQINRQPPPPREKKIIEIVPPSGS